MKSRFTGVVVLCMICMGQTVQASDWVIVPGVRVGPIARDTSERGLEVLYGKSQVVAADIDIGEGETLPGTILFPGQPEKMLSILWADKSHRQINEIRINANSTKWITDKGITIGTALDFIQRLNGRPVGITGFGWDYSGTITTNYGGNLKELGNDISGGIQHRTLLLRAEPGSGQYSSVEYNAVLGDGEFKSDHPAMKALNPRVYEMIIHFK